MTTWNLRLLYKSERDPQLLKDLERIRQSVLKFRNKYLKFNLEKAPSKAVSSSLKAYEKVYLELSSAKPLLYFYFRNYLNSSDKKTRAELNRLSYEFSKLGNEILFFELALGKLSAKRQKALLGFVDLKPFHYFLERVFNEGRYALTELEERIVNLKSLPASSLWRQGMNKILNKQTVRFGKSVLPIGQAMEMIPDQPRKKRQQLHQIVMDKLAEVSDFAESEINALYSDKKIEDELRSRPNPYSSRVMSAENSEAEVLSLVESVTKNFKISHKFYAIKAKALGVKSLGYADRQAPLGTASKKISYKAGLDILRGVFGKLGPDYQEVIDRFVKEGRIDVFPRLNKTSGAFCHSSPDTPTYVLLNWVDNLKSLFTFAHEMGHAVHSEFSKVQTPLYRNYSLAVAETASTLFEDFVFGEVFETLSEREKVVALHDRINTDIATISRQVACFNFELELHQAIRAKGSVDTDYIVQLMNKHMKSYLGPKFKLEPRDGYFFVAWSHIRNFFYVYTYAYGRLVSRALYARYKADPSYIESISEFLSAGGSKAPEAIFKGIGINTRSKSFFEEGLRDLDSDITRLGKLLS